MRHLQIGPLALGLTILAAPVAARPVGIDDLARITDIGNGYWSDLQVSPDGRFVALQEQTADPATNTYLREWKIVPLADGAPPTTIDISTESLLVSFCHKKEARDPTGVLSFAMPLWLQDGSGIVYLKPTNGKVDVWRATTDGRREQLTRMATSVTALAQDPASPSFLISVAPTTAEVVAAVPNEKSGNLYDARFTLGADHPPASAIQNAIKGPERLCGDRVLILDPASAKTVTAGEHAIEALSVARTDYAIESRTFSEAGMAPPASAMSAAFENADPNVYKGYRPLKVLVAKTGSRSIRCAAPQCTTLFGRDQWAIGNSVYFLTYTGAFNERQSLFAWSPGSSKVRIIYDSEALLRSCTLSAKRAICLRETHTRPAHIVSIDLRTGKVAEIYDPNPSFRELEFTRIETIGWHDPEGDATYGHLVYPRDYRPGTRYPLVLTTYKSRGFLRGGVGDEYPVHALAANGFFVLSHDIPDGWSLAAKSEDTLNDLFKDQRLHRNILASQETIVRQLIARGLVDPAHVAITGLSEGATEVSAALIHSSLFKLGIASSASYSPDKYYFNPKVFRDRWRPLLGDVADARSGWYWHSIGHAAPNKPYLVNVADRELWLSRDAFGRLESAGRPAELHVFADEHHIKWQPAHRHSIYRRNLQWLQFWFQGIEVDDPVDLSQYERWRKLKQLHGAGERETATTPSQ